MELFYKKMGDSGSVIIILHGLFGNGRNWHSIAKYLSKNYQVYSIDLRNHGMSPHSNSMSYEEMVFDIKEFIKTHNLKDINLIGHSMGGKVSMLFALNFPQLIKHLVIIDIAPIAYKHSFAEIFNGLISLPLEQIKTREQADGLLKAQITTTEIRQFLLQNLCLGDGDVNNYWRFNLPVLNDSISSIVDFPAVEENKNFSSSCLFIAGADSDYINNSNRKTIKHFFPGSNIVKVKNAGHWLHAEQPEVLKKILIGYLVS